MRGIRLVELVDSRVEVAARFGALTHAERAIGALYGALSEQSSGFPSLDVETPMRTGLAKCSPATSSHLVTPSSNNKP